MLKTILSISGKPGLYKLVSHGKNMLIVESLTDNKRVPAYAKDKVISLGDIAIYTDETEVPLHEVLTSVKNKEEPLLWYLPKPRQTNCVRTLPRYCLAMIVSVFIQATSRNYSLGITS